MITIIKLTSTILLGVIFSCSTMLAQNQVLPGRQLQQRQMHRTHMAKPVLTDAQKVMLKENRQKINEMREAFKATITQAQKDKLTNPRLVKEDRIKAFRASLTDQQVSMIKARQKQMKENRAKFKATLTDQQKLQLKRMAAIKNNKNQKGYNNHNGYKNQANIKRDRVHR